MAKANSGGATRAAAAQAVHAVLSDGASLEQCLPSATTDFSDDDAAFIRALVFGALRGHLLHRQLINACLSKPLKRKDRVLEALLSVGFYQLLSDRQPDYAAVSATVEATRDLRRPHAKGLVNAVLRRFIRERDSLLSDATAGLEATHGLPEWLLQRLQADWPDQWQQIAAGSDRQAPMWLRVNRARTTTSDYLAKAGLAATTADAFPDALLLETPLPVSALPGFAAGDCSVQDAAAQMAAHLLDPQPGERVLDACAAPGGKTCHLLERQPELGEVVALDSSAERLERVHENLGRLQLSATVVEGDATDPSGWWDNHSFDRILVDAPCSATGVIRRHPDIKFLRRDSDIAVLAQLQGDILDALWPLLRPGGRLLYATCSVLRAENDATVAAFLHRQSSAEALPLPGSPALAGVSEGIGLQLLPGGDSDTDGFYYALIAKGSG